MSSMFADVPFIGKMYFHHTYLFYDEPLIFSCINQTFQYYFVVAIPDNSNGEEEWLVVPVSQGRLSRLEKNAEEIRAPFLNPESFVFRVQHHNSGNFEAFPVDPKDLTEDLLPNQGALLDYSNTGELQPSNVPSVVQAKSEMRDILELSFEQDDTHISEIPCLALTESLNGIQQLIYAIGYKEGKLRGPIPKKVRDDCKLCVSGMFAASVGIRLKSNEFCDLCFETPLTTALSDFNHLFDISHDKAQLKEWLANQSPRVAVRYRALLRSLLNNKIGININNASPNEHLFVKHFSTKELAESLTFVNSEVDAIIEKETLYGQLVGINVERCTFEFIATDGESIKGTLADELKGDTFSIPQTIKAFMEVSVGADSVTKEEKLIYKLVSAEPVVPNLDSNI